MAIADSASSKNEQSKLRRFLTSARWLFRSAMWLLILAWLLSFFGPWFFVAELLVNFSLQFCVAFVICLLLSKPAKVSRIQFVCMLVAALLTGWETGRLFLPADQPSPGQTKLRVMSYNVLATNMEFEVAIKEIRRQDPDVVVLLEYANIWHVAMDSFNETYPHQHRDPRWHGYGIAIFSKVPLENSHSVQLTADEIDNPSAITTINLDDVPVRLMASHVASPITPYRLELRNRQFEDIAEIINSDDGATVLVGDMNSSTSSRFLSKLANETGLRDSRQGFGFQPSWTRFGPWLAVPIDHVFVSDLIHVHDRFLGSAGGSDHCPVIVDLSVSRP